jgi:subtilisin family serine protease
VNWRCKLVACKVFERVWDDDDSEWKCLAANTEEALEYAILTGCRISNNSWGGYTFKQSMYDMIETAMGYGHVFVAAAGNDSNDNDGEWPHYPASYDLPNIIAVAAMNRDDHLASFSNFGADTVDLGAPGDDVLSTVEDGYETKNGTSMATPHVAGALGLLLGLHPEFSWQQLKDRILNAVRLVTELDGITVTGGVLDVLRVVGIWVEFGYTGTEEGSFAKPFNTFGEGLSATPTAGDLFLKAGEQSWTGTIDQTLTIETYQGSAVIAP